MPLVWPILLKWEEGRLKQYDVIKNPLSGHEQESKQKLSKAGIHPILKFL